MLLHLIRKAFCSLMSIVLPNITNESLLCISVLACFTPIKSDENNDDNYCTFLTESEIHSVFQHLHYSLCSFQPSNELKIAKQRYLLS